MLWKLAKPGEPSWPSPFGEGRPGWHTECVVMALDLLGDGFDIHGGGLDLAFPHHENERAQAVAEGHDFTHFWVHNGFVEVDGTKMSKSLGNFTNLVELIDQHDPRAFRLLVLRAHYRSPIDVSPATITDAEVALARLDAFARRAAEADVAPTLPDTEVMGRFVAAMDDDLDTPAATAVLFDTVRRANAALDDGSDQLAPALVAAPTRSPSPSGSCWAHRRRRTKYLMKFWPALPSVTRPGPPRTEARTSCAMGSRAMAGWSRTPRRAPACVAPEPATFRSRGSPSRKRLVGRSRARPF